MPPQMITCVFCGTLVSKRQSLSLETLGVGQGRACRGHTQVTELVTALQLQREMQRSMDEVQLRLRVMSAVVMIRILHTFQGVPVDLLYHKMTRAGFKPAELRMIRDEVARSGGPLMSADETTVAAFMAIEIIRRQAADFTSRYFSNT